MPIDLSKLSDAAILAVALDAEASEDDVSRVLEGRHVPPARAGRILAALSNRGIDLAQLPSMAAAQVCADAPERTTNGRLSRADLGPNFHASRRDRG